MGRVLWWWGRPQMVGEIPRLPPLAQVTIGLILFVAVVAVLARLAGWNQSVITQYGLLMLAIIGGMVAVWYAMETHEMRKESARQTKESVEQSKALRDQLKILHIEQRDRHMPMLIPHVYDTARLRARWRPHGNSREEVADVMESWLLLQTRGDDEHRVAKEIRNFVEAKIPGDSELFCVIDNVGDEPALSVWVYVVTGRRTYAPIEVRSIIAPGTAVSCLLSHNAYGDQETPLSSGQAEYMLSMVYGHNVDIPDNPSWMDFSGNYVVVIFRSYSGEVYKFISETSLGGPGVIKSHPGSFTFFHTDLLHSPKRPRLL